MPERLVHRTWSVRTVSGPFPVPLFGHRRRIHPKSSISPPSRNGDRRRGGGAASGAAQSPPPDPMDEAESDLSSFVRRSQPRRQPQELAEYDGGTYVSLSWIRLPAADDLVGEDEEDSSGAEVSHSGRKRPRSQMTGAGAGAEETGRFQSSGEDDEEEDVRRHRHHLHVHVWVRDAEAAQLVFCFARFVVPSSPKEGTTTSPRSPRQSLPVDSFAYVLVRGSPAAYLPVLSWLEETSGCRVGPKPFRPSPVDVSRAAADWTLLARRRLLLAKRAGSGHLVSKWRGTDGGEEEQEEGDDGLGGSRGGGRGTPGGGGDDDDGDEVEASAAASRMLRPLEVTFDAPRRVAEAGLEKITLTVPHTSLWRLCCAIEDAAPSPPSSSSTPRPPSRRGWTSERDEDRQQYPILAALHSYFRESFRVDLSSFPLARAASSAAVIGRDGRLKPLDVGLVGAVLGGLRRMMEGRVGNNVVGGGGGVVVGGPGRYDDEDEE